MGTVVINEFGVGIYYIVAVHLMDDELCEELSRSFVYDCSPQEFFDAYCIAHQKKFGEVWELAKPNPCYKEDIQLW